MKNDHHKFSEPKGTSSDCFSCPTNKGTSFKNINDKKATNPLIYTETMSHHFYITCIKMHSVTTLI